MANPYTVYGKVRQFMETTTYANIFNLGNAFAGRHGDIGSFLDEAGHQGGHATKQTSKGGLEQRVDTDGARCSVRYSINNDDLI